MMRVAGPWFRYFLTYDPRTALARVKCPVLALNGELDLQVTIDENLPAIEKALRAGVELLVATPGWKAGQY